MLGKLSAKLLLSISLSLLIRYLLRNNGRIKMKNLSLLDKYPVLFSDDQKFARRKRGFKNYESYVPYGLLIPHEKQAMENHCGQ